MFRVGLTGGIATGKSRVGRRLAAAGLRTIDLDVIAHEVMAPGGAAYAEVVRTFGPAILAPDGQVDRGALGAIVFEDAKARERLNAVVHPRVREEEQRRTAAFAAQPGAVVVTDAALLVESGLHLRFDRLVVVHCPPELQVRRLMVRDGIDDAAARLRVMAQMPGEEKRRFGHFEIETSGPVEETDRASDALAQELRALAASAGPRAGISPGRALSCLVHGPRDGPRGLSPAGLVAELASHRALDMDQTARLLLPPAPGPWYQQARSGQDGPGPEVLAGPLALWSLTRGAPDSDFLAGASATLARLTHRDPVAISTAVLFGQAFLDAAVTGRIPHAGGPDWTHWRRVASRWGQAEVPAWTERVLQAAGAHGRDPGAASAEAARLAAPEPALAGALAGLASGTPGVTGQGSLASDLARLLGS